MKAVLHIQVIDKAMDVSFHTVALRAVSGSSSATVFSLDNHSSADMISYALEMFERATQLLVLTECKASSAGLGKLVSLFNQIMRNPPADFKWILLGKHDVVEKMAKPLQQNFISQPDADLLSSITKSLFR